MFRTFSIPAALLALGSTCAFAQYIVRPSAPVSATDLANRLPAQLVGVGIEEHLGRAIDLDLTFNDEDGKVVKLRDFFNKGRPVLLDLVYYNCPQLCTLILNRQVEIMKQMPQTPGNQYEVVTHQHRSARNSGNRQQEESDRTWRAMESLPPAGTFSPIATITPSGWRS